MDHLIYMFSKDFEVSKRCFTNLNNGAHLTIFEWLHSDICKFVLYLDLLNHKWKIFVNEARISIWSKSTMV